DVVEKDKENRIDLAWKFALCLYSDGRFNEAEALFIEVMESHKGILGAEHPSTLTSINNLVSMFWNQGQLKEAKELEVQVMETRLRVLGAEHPSTLTVWTKATKGSLDG